MIEPPKLNEEGSTKKFMEYKELLEAQLRECYGRVVYSHKTHEKCADILLDKNSKFKMWQLILSGLTTGSFLVTVFGDGKISALIGAVISAILLVLNSYTKDFELVEIAEKHKQAASSLWDIRESYLSLLTDMPFLSIEEITNKRDQLQDQLRDTYEGSPRTNFKAYKSAQNALKNNEELTFSEEEIDLLLPAKLRKNKP